LHPFIVVIALIGTIIFWRRSYSETDLQGKFSFLLIIALAGHFTLMFMVLAPFPRYSLPLGPVLYILFSLALEETWKFYSLKAKPARTLPGHTPKKEA
jgi:hypothetical protein